MPSTLKNVESPKSTSRIPGQNPKSGAGKPEGRSAGTSDTVLFFALFFMPVVTYVFVLAMTRIIHLQIGDALVWEQPANYWASLYKQTGQYFCIALLVPAFVSIVRTRPVLARTSTALAVLFMLISFAFVFGAPKTYPAPPAPAVPVVIEKPAPVEVKAEPAPEPAAVIEPAPAPVAETRPAKRKGWFILFPLYTKTENTLSFIFPLHFQVEKDNGDTFFWLFPYTSHIREDAGQLLKTYTFLYPLYIRSEQYSGENRISSKRRFLFFRKSEGTQTQA